MNEVEAIKDVKQIDKIKKYLMYHDDSLRDFTFFEVGINSGLRISDLLSLRVDDVVDFTKLGKNCNFTKKCIRDRIRLKEKKTGKVKDFPLSDTAKDALYKYLLNNEYLIRSLYVNECYNCCLFPSRKGGEALSRIQAYRILTDAAKIAGVQGSIGTHTMRKTFGYHAYLQCKSLGIVSKLLNHSSEAQTLRYIGITKQDLDKVYLNLNL